MLALFDLHETRSYFFFSFQNKIARTIISFEQIASIQYWWNQLCWKSLNYRYSNWFFILKICCRKCGKGGCTGYFMRRIYQNAHVKLRSCTVCVIIIRITILCTCKYFKVMSCLLRFSVSLFIVLAGWLEL